MYQDTSATAFSTNDYQYLGQKTFWYFLSERLAVPFGFLVLALIVSVLRVQSFITSDIAVYMQLASRVLFGIFIVVGLISFFIARLTYRSTAFKLGEDALVIKRGIITTEEFAIPYRQIQNIEIERSLYQRTMGISKLIILTAAEDNNDKEDEGIIPAIDKDVATNLQAELLKRSSVQKVIQA